MIRLAILSDLHAVEATNESSSWLVLGRPDNLPRQHPITGLHELIKREALTADYLICCGDLGDKAVPSALQYAWKSLHEIKSALKAPQLIAAPGNHDLDSRHKHNDFDAKGSLQGLVPPFPLQDTTKNDFFWANNFVLLDQADSRFLILNTAAYHGTESVDSKPEYLHGRVARRTVERIRSELEGSAKKPVNVLVCHHHPHRHDDIEDDDYSVMKGGEHLLGLLESGRYGRWLVVHGHKHHPRVCYGAGGSAAPIVFSCGSFSAKLFADQQVRGRNQFYMIDLPFRDYARCQVDLGGQFTAWNWSQGEGWCPASREPGLPHRGGFGYRKDIQYLARDVVAAIQKLGLPLVSWSEILRITPELRFLLPRDLAFLIENMQRDHGLKVTFSATGEPEQVSSVT